MTVCPGPTPHNSMWSLNIGTSSAPAADVVGTLRNCHLLVGSPASIVPGRRQAPADDRCSSAPDVLTTGSAARSDDPAVVAWLKAGAARRPPWRLIMSQCCRILSNNRKHHSVRLRRRSGPWSGIIQSGPAPAGRDTLGTSEGDGRGRAHREAQAWRSFAFSGSESRIAKCSAKLAACQRLVPSDTASCCEP